MSTYTATVAWAQPAEDFPRNRYSRAHTWTFDGGAVVPASSSPQVVRLPMSDPAGVDPEEAMVAALSSCHMLWFLSLAAAKGYSIAAYRDEAVGTMASDAAGKEWLATVRLRPHVVFSGPKRPDDAAVAALHHQAHEECFIANSVRSEVLTEGSWAHQG